MSEKNPLTPYEEAMRSIDRIIAELDHELERLKYKEDKSHDLHTP